MEQRIFGATELHLSAVGFGAWGIGGPAMAGTVPLGWGAVDDATSLAALREARARGITFFDTADFYGLGHSEALIGSVFGNDPTVIIATKVGHRIGSDNSVLLDYSRNHIFSACDASLRRLRRETIDYYQLHSAKLQHLKDGECVDAMGRLVREGKVRYWGISLNTFHPEPEAEYCIERKLGDGFQVVLNVVNQKAIPLIAKAARAGFGVIARMPLQFGLLTGKFTPATVFTGDDHRAFRLPPPVLTKALESLADFWSISRERTMSPVSLALSFCVSVPGVSTVIPGIKTPAQAQSNTEGIVRLGEADMIELHRLFEGKLRNVVELMEKAG